MAARNLSLLLCAGALCCSLQGCTGILSSVYDDEAGSPRPKPTAGQLYIDASDWGEWHYIDLPATAAAVSTDSNHDTSECWLTYDIPTEADPLQSGACGIYTYWYDVFGAGIESNEFRAFTPTAAQPEPSDWTIAVHRNNVRTNGCAVACTKFATLDAIPADRSFINALAFEEDSWSENEVWCEQGRMLLGLIGCQGITINRTLSQWLSIAIPPMPPAFTLCSDIFILRLPDGTFAAVQLENYQSASGTKCCLTINYRYPI